MSENTSPSKPDFVQDPGKIVKLEFSNFESNGEQIVFGDFGDVEYEQYFVDNQNVAGVEFLFSSQVILQDDIECNLPTDQSELQIQKDGVNLNGNMDTSISSDDVYLNGDLTSAEGLSSNDTVHSIETFNSKETSQNASPGSVKSSTTVKQNSSQPAKPSSWASLFKSTESPPSTDLDGKRPVVLSVNVDSSSPKTVLNEPDKPIDVTVIPLTNDDRAVRLAQFISKQPPKYSRHHLQLRGLVNRCNWCYINSTLQALLAIPPITHFYKTLKSFHEPLRKSTSTPLTDSMINFFSEFEPINPRLPLKKQTDDVRGGEAFEPKCIYEMLPVTKTTLSEKGRQQDAEEFLSFLLNGVHEELVSLLKLAQSPAQTENEKHLHMNGNVKVSADNTNTEETANEDSWECVGPKNKSAMVRSATINDSLIKHVFGGVIRSSVHQSGVKESATLQPFFTLQLDIQNEKVWNLKEAIEYYFMKENLQGFTCSKTNAEVEASRRSTLEELPHIFIFHLKYFVYDRTGGCQKLHKAIDIPVDLEIPKDILSPGLKSRTLPNMRNYKLFAVVYHHGKNAAGGHYTACVHHGNPFGWVRFDDNLIKPVPVTQVLKHQQGRVPYLLFYERIQS